MEITIGEIINDILPHANLIESKMYGDTPFVHAVMNNGKSMFRFHLYVVQINEHEYAACDTIDDISNDKYIVTRNSNNPLITEKEFVSNWLNETKHKNCQSSVVNHLSYNKFIDYLIDRLSFHDVIKFNTNDFNKRISSLISGGSKYKNQITRVFRESGCKSDTIKDLVDLVYKNGSEINFDGIKQKNFMAMISKLSQLGIITINKGNRIVKINFEKRK